MQVAGPARTWPVAQFRSPGQGSGASLGHCRRHKGFQGNDRRDEILPRRGRAGQPVPRRHRSDERDAGGLKERTREIGVRKAVGASARVILRQFFIETLIVVFLSGGIGLGIAYGLTALVDLLPMPMYFAGLLPTWQSAVLSFALLGTVALCSALYPGRRAAQVDLIVALP